MKKKYVKGFEDYKKAVKEGLSIYEFEDDVQEPVADLDAETEKAEEAPSEEAPAPAEAPEATEAPVEEAPVAEEPKEEAPAEQAPSTDEASASQPLDFGDNGTNMSVEEMTSKLDFIDGVIEEYKKLIKKGEVVDPKIQARIQGAFDSIS